MCFAGWPDHPRHPRDTERAGEREIEQDATGGFAKRAGSYTALQNKTELEYGLTNDLLFEFGSFLSYHRVRNWRPCARPGSWPPNRSGRPSRARSADDGRDR